MPREDFYLVVSAFAPYKRLDLAVDGLQPPGPPAGGHRHRPGRGPAAALAGPTVRFLGWQPDEVIRDHLRRCRALLFPGEEDFGIVPVEAMACGAPVIAFGRGGATETVLPPGGRHEPTGLWFAEQTADCLADAPDAFESGRTSSRRPPPAVRPCASTSNDTKRKWRLFWPTCCDRRRRRRGGRRDEIEAP